MPDGAAVVVAAPGAAVVVVPSGWTDGFDGADGSDGLDGSEGLAGAAVVVVPSAAVISQKKRFENKHSTRSTISGVDCTHCVHRSTYNVHVLIAST